MTKLELKHAIEAHLAQFPNRRDGLFMDTLLKRLFCQASDKLSDADLVELIDAAWSAGYDVGAGFQ